MATSVVVTGGHGRIGRLLVRDLRGRGVRVVSLARTHDAQPHPDDIAVDLVDAEAVHAAVVESGAEVLVHLASVLRGDALEQENDRIDRAVAGAVRAAEIAHVVHASSGAVYGVRAETARDELSPVDATSPYARSKLAAERLFAELVEDEGTRSAISLRIFNVAGAAFEDSLVHRILHAHPSQPVPLLAPDHFVRDYIHQDDLVDVLRAAIGSRAPGAHVLNVGAGIAVSTRMLLEEFGTDPALVQEKAGEPNCNWADITRLVRVLGVTPRAVPDRTWA